MIVLIYGGMLVRASVISIGDIVAFMGYLSALAWPTVSFGWTLSIYQRGRASMKRLEEIFVAVPTTSVAGDEARLEIAGSVEWENVSFSYFANGLAAHGNGSATVGNGNNDGPGETHRWALRNIDVKVPAGGKLAIVGRTGAGKSTMVKLLSRLIEPTHGRILLDGRDIRELPLNELRTVM